MTDERISLEDYQSTLDDIASTESISLERYPQNAFFKKFTVWRKGLAPGHFVDMEDKKFQLPDNSVVHMVSNFLHPDPKAIVDPDLSSPYITHETWRKAFATYYEIPSPEDPLVPVTDLHIFQKGPVKGQLMKFYNSHPKIKRILSDVSIGKIAQSLIIYDYGLLQRTKLPGMMSHYRLTDLILRAIIRHIVSYPFKKNHFIHIPLSDRYYPRAKFLQAFKRIHNSTIKFADDPSYDFLIHLLGFVYGIENPDTVVTPSPNDQRAINKGTLSLNLTGSTSIFNRLNDEELSSINIILEHKDKSVIYNLKLIKDFTRKGAFFYQFYKHIMRLKLSSLTPAEVSDFHNDDGSDTEEDVLETENSPVEEAVAKDDNLLPSDTSTKEEEVTEEIEKTIKEDKKNRVLKPLSKTLSSNFGNRLTAKPSKLTKEEEHEDLTEDNEGEIFNDTVEEETGEKIDTTPDIGSILVDEDVESYIERLEPAAKKRAIKLIGKLDSISLHGKSLKDHLTTAPKALMRNNIVEDDVTVIDPETKSSSILGFDQQYVKHNLHTDLAKNILSFMKQGFFVTNLSEKRDVTRIDDTTTYKVKFISVHDGKQHNVSFTLPNPDEEGVFKDNGNEYRLVKQKTAMPIAKISDSKVGLFSSYNKSTVERTETRNSFKRYILRVITNLVTKDLIKPQYGNPFIDEITLPLDYTFISSRYSSLEFKPYSGSSLGSKPYKLTFNYNERFSDLTDKQITIVKKLEEKLGVYTGLKGEEGLVFYGHDNVIRIIEDGKISFEDTITPFLEAAFPDEEFPNIPYEYTLVTLISERYPLIFLLGLIHGLIPTLKHIKAKYRFIPKGKALNLKSTECRIRFNDGSIVFNRYPLLQSFILSGLSWCNPEHYSLLDFEKEDTYYDILIRKGISTNQIKGIKSFFNLFMDPTTKSILESIHEPTNVTDLLIRATEMLTTEAHYPASSERNYRFRSFERYTAIVYNELARAIATYDSDRTRGKTLDVNPKAVYQRVYGDPAKTLVDVINPIHEIKEVSKGSYAGIGGRTGRSFVVNDRTYSPDSIGVISEATPDSGKVGMIFTSVMDPNIVDLYGLTIPHEKDKEITSTAKLLSVVGNLFAGIDQDDGKRANFTGIQLSHHVPCANGEVTRIRTGTESLIAHMSGKNFSAKSPFAGTITDVDTKLQLVELTPFPVKAKSIGSIPFKAEASEIDKHSANFHTFRTYIPKGEYQLNGVYKLTSKSVGLLTDINKTPKKESIPEAIIKRYKTDDLYLVTFTLSREIVTPKPTVFDYGVKYTRSQGTYLKQDLVCAVNKGDKVKKGDILVYNAGFFTPKTDPFGPGSDIGVDWKHGVMANILLLENSSTYEDACAITEELGDKLVMHPAHVRQVTINKDAIVHECASVGDEVYSTDPIMVIEEGDIEILGISDNIEVADFTNSLSRKSVKAKYHGKVVEVNYLYGCSLKELHPTIQKLVTAQEKKALTIAKRKGETGDILNSYSGYIKPGTKYQGIEFTEETVLLEFTIEETIGTGEGDKICIMTSNKTVVSKVLEKSPITKSGLKIDAIFSVTSPYKRIVNTPFIHGIGNLALEQAEKNIVDIYFG